MALDTLLRYARAMLEKPEGAGDVREEDVKKVAAVEGGVKKDDQEEDEEEEDEELDQDIHLLLLCALPLFQSRSSGVVLGTARLFYHLAPAGKGEIGQGNLVLPLLRLVDGLTTPEVASVVVDACVEVAEQRPVSFFLASDRCKAI